MADILHEVWVTKNEDSVALHSCIIAGSMGDGARELLKTESAEFKYSFLASSHVDAMMKYHRKVHSEIYSTKFSDPWDFEPYPAEWAEIQRKDGICLSGFS